MGKNIQRQELKTQLTPQQILKANILQLNAILLEQRIVRELETNPVLEESEISPDEAEDIQSEEEDSEEETEFNDHQILQTQNTKQVFEATIIDIAHQSQEAARPNPGDHGQEIH